MSVDPARLHALLDAAQRATGLRHPVAELAPTAAPVTDAELDQVSTLLAELHAAPMDREQLRQALQPRPATEMDVPGSSEEAPSPSRVARGKAWLARLGPLEGRLEAHPALASRGQWETKRRRAQQWEHRLVGGGAALLVLTMVILFAGLGPLADAHYAAGKAAVAHAGSVAAWMGDPAHRSASYLAWVAEEARLDVCIKAWGLVGATGMGLAFLGLPWSVRARRLRPVKVSQEDQLLWAHLPETRAYLAARPSDIPLLQVERDQLRQAVSRSDLARRILQIGPDA